MTDDIKRYGAGSGLGYYWIKRSSYPGGNYRSLVAVDELGNVTDTGTRADHDEAAMSEEEAVLTHLADAVAQADADLEKRRATLPEPEPKPEPMDPATARLYEEVD